ncbi:MAG: CDP-alcohol phosphatidyltransferase family protein [Thermoleophilia bacterium]|nr:CDP-alcohol phosphatidyltransferase family protein [Thermoleophilia bacterium]
MENIREFFGTQLRRSFLPVISALRWLKVTPNEITVAGTVLNVAAAALVVADHLIYAGIVFLVAGCFDMLDGALARLAQKVTPFGAFLDSTLDRVSEGVMFAAIAYMLAVEGRSIDVGLVVLALLGSILVSYTRARAESLDVECKVGLMSRPERIILIAIGLFFDVLPYVIYIMLALTVFTVVQRVVHTYRQLNKRKEQGGFVER